MKETELCRLAKKWNCDKTPLIRHGYTPYYHQLFSGRTIKRLLEIGIQGGNSLRMWREYFPEAEIFGIDIEPSSIFQEDRIYTARCDASNESALRSVAIQFGGSFDVIVDDASHLEEHQVSTFHTLRSFLTPDGVYIIEDVGRVQIVSDQLSFPNEIHRFDPHSQFGDDNLIVFFNEEFEL
jgi:SAM-dependent methyltransferase